MTSVAYGIAMPSMRGMLSTPAWLAASDPAAADVLALGRRAASCGATSAPVDSGTLTLGGGGLGGIDVMIVNGPVTLTAANVADWLTAVADSRSAWLVIKGDLIIPSGVTLVPAARKLFTVIYVTGDLTVDGAISMTARGANHSATGSNITAAAIPIATGTFSGVVNPHVPAAGGAGAAGVGPLTWSKQAGNLGAAGTDGGTGGGGSGAVWSAAGSTSASGSGADGTSFSGGPGSGGISSNAGSTRTGVHASGAGGSGGAGDGVSYACGGGAGNPGGDGYGANGNPGGDGTGGVLVVISEGALSGAGTISADGADGGAASGASYVGGAGSGGGSVTVMSGSDASAITPTANGGQGQAANYSGPSGNGGAGTARKLALAA